MRWCGIALLISSVLGACGGPTVESEQAMAEYACLVRALAIQGNLEKALAEENEGTDANVDEWPDPSFRFVSTGQFVIDYGRVPGANGAQAFDLRCTGDFNARRFTTVQINGFLNRPAEGDAWPIDWYGENITAD